MTTRVQEVAESRIERTASDGVTVGVIVPTYNRASLVTQALDSILGQTRPPDDIVVVDDGSIDDTEQALQRYADKIRYVRQPNAGKPVALNRGIPMLDTDYVWIMDDDDVAAHDALERHLDYLGEHPETDYTYSGVWCFTGDGAPPPPERCLLWQRHGAIPHGIFFARALEEFPCNQQTMLVPLACYRAVGLYDEKQTFVEDYDMILRLARRYRAGFVEEPTVFLRQHGGDRGPARERKAATERFEAWRPYERRLFLALRHSLPLAEYLSRESATDGLGPLDTRRALLQRACVMARHGLFDAALEDLDAALSGDAPFAPPWQAEDRRICGQMFNVEPVLLERQGGFLHKASRTLSQVSALHQAAAAGLSWSMRAELRAGHYGGAARMGAYLARWAGPTGLAVAAAAKLVQKSRAWSSDRADHRQCRKP